MTSTEVTVLDTGETDITAALTRLTEVAKGRAFHWDNQQSNAPRGWRVIDRVEIKVQMTVMGRETYSSIALAADHTNALLGYGRPTLAQAEREAAALLKLLPSAADVVPVDGLPPSVHIGPAANDAVPPAAEGVA